MFRFFKRRKKGYPAFDALNSFQKRDYYFVRMASWRWLNHEQIVVTDPHGPRMLTLDPWPQLLFIAADGNRTIKEYIFYVADQYTEAIPANLDAVMIGEIEKLLQYKIIGLSAAPARPENRFDKPLA